MDIALMQTDRDGGYACMSRHVLDLAYMSITQCADYVCLLPNEVESDAAYKRICQRWDHCWLDLVSLPKHINT